MTAPEPDTVLVPARVLGRVLVRRARRPSRGLIIGFHGYAESAAVHLPRLEALDPSGGWTLASVQALSRFYRGRTDTTVAAWMTREDRETVIADNIAYVDGVVARVLPDPSVLVCAGFSQGAAMAFRTAVRGARRATAVIAVGGDVPPELLQDASVRFPPVLLVRGARDEWYTREKLEADVAALEARGATVCGATVDGGHEWNTDASAAALAFLERATGRI